MSRDTNVSDFLEVDDAEGPAKKGSEGERGGAKSRA